MAGLGVAFISAHTIELELNRLVILDVEGMPVHRQWFLVSRMDRSLSHALAAFQDYVINHAADHVPK